MCARCGPDLGSRIQNDKTSRRFTVQYEGTNDHYMIHEGVE